MKRLLLFPLLILVLLPAGCDSNGSDDDADDVLLRVKNETDVDFSSAFVSFPNAEASYGVVAAGETSDYREFETAYRYGYVEVEAGGEQYVIQPIDYVGEDPLQDGRYIYALDFDEGDLSVSFER